MSSDLGSVGAFGAVVWPTYVGVLNDQGVEPIWWLQYQRSQIRWGADDEGILFGRTLTKLVVPKGVYTDIIYTHQPSGHLLVAVQPLAQPFTFTAESEIELVNIRESDFNVEVKSWQH